MRLVHDVNCAIHRDFASLKDNRASKAKCTCGVKRKYRGRGEPAGDHDMHGISIGEGCYLKQRARIPY